ncbi:TPA: hypothetical protein R5A90_001732 [Campylobacter jejuni]|nr:hypothetical protein [Campylobacter jejuni]
MKNLQIINYDVEKYNIEVGGGLYQYLDCECLLNLVKFNKNTFANNDFCILTSLMSNEYVFLFLSVNQKIFILVQKFSIDMIIDITSNKINKLSKISNEQVEYVLNMLKMKVDFLVNNGVDFYKKLSYDYKILKSSRKTLFFISYPRPSHYFQDFLYKFFLIKNKITKDKPISIISLIQTEYMDLNYDDDIVTYETISDDMANQFIIENDFIVWRPIRNLIIKDDYTPNMKENFYFWLKNISLKNYPKFRKSIIYEIMKYKYKIWISVARQGRKWIEQEQGIVELSRSLKKCFGENVCIILDSLTSSLYYGKEAYALRDEEMFYVESLSRNLKVKSFNIFGFSSAEKINIAHCVDFYIGNMNTDMLYPCYIAKKYGVCYGSVENYDIKKQDKEVQYLNFFPIEYVKTINPEKIFCRSDYSIDPTKFAKYMSDQIYLYFRRDK